MRYRKFNFRREAPDHVSRRLESKWVAPFKRLIHGESGFYPKDRTVHHEREMVAHLGRKKLAVKIKLVRVRNVIDHRVEHLIHPT